jgi:FHS family Na+ dependent glucose MFS transporter 1
MSEHKTSINAIAPTMVFYFSFILLGLTMAVTGPTLTTLAKHTSSRIDQISYIFITGSLGYLIGSMIGGRLYDKFPANRVVPIGLLVLAASSAYVPSASQLVILVMAIFILGLSQGVIDVGGNTLLIWIHGNGVGPFMNGLHFFFGVGALISPILVAQFFKYSGEIFWVYRLFGLMAIPLAIWSWFLGNPTRQNKASAEPTGKINYVLVLFISLLFFLYVGAEIGFGNWIFTYTTSLGLGTAISAAYLTSAFWGFFTLGRLLGIPISTKVDLLKILFADLIGCLVSLGVIILGSNSTLALWMGTIFLGLSMASFFATLMSLAERKLHISGQVTGLFLVGAGLGGMFLPWFIGQTFTSIGPKVMPIAIFIDMLLNLILLVALTSRFTQPNIDQTAIAAEKSLV